MKFYKNLLLAFFLSIPLSVNAAQEEDNQFNLSNCPKDIVVTISSHLNDQGKLNLRQASKAMRQHMEASYQQEVEREFNIFFKNDDGAAPFHYTNYLKSLFTRLSKHMVQKDGYIFAPQGTLAEEYLSKNYSRINLYPFLKEDSVWAKDLFHALFGRQMPEGKEDLALKLLTACLPIDHIYSTYEADPFLVFIKFREDSHKSFITALKAMREQERYFLVGIDEDKDRLKTGSHSIVMNQSNMTDLYQLYQQGYLLEDFFHTLIYNADREVLNSPRMPSSINKLILTNVNNKCTSIGNNFFMYGYNLTSVELRGFTNLTSIGNGFFSRCDKLVSIKLGQLPNLETIGNDFLMRCEKLTSVELNTLANIKVIPNKFLYGCEMLTSVNLNMFLNVTTIGDDFFNLCRNLTSLNLGAFSNVTAIGHNFLFYCNNLNSIDLSGLSTAIYTLIVSNADFQKLGLSPQDETNRPQLWTKQFNNMRQEDEE